MSCKAGAHEKHKKRSIVDRNVRRFCFKSYSLISDKNLRQKINTICWHSPHSLKAEETKTVHSLCNIWSTVVALGKKVYCVKYSPIASSDNSSSKRMMGYTSRNALFSYIDIDNILSRGCNSYTDNRDNARKGKSKETSCHHSRFTFSKTSPVGVMGPPYRPPLLPTGTLPPTPPSPVAGASLADAAELPPPCFGCSRCCHSCDWISVSASLRAASMRCFMKPDGRVDIAEFADCRSRLAVFRSEVHDGVRLGGVASGQIDCGS